MGEGWGWGLDRKDEASLGVVSEAEEKDFLTGICLCLGICLTEI